MHDMPFSVYWYGGRDSPLYSLVPRRIFVPYKEGVKKGYHKIPTAVQKRLDHGLKPIRKHVDHLEALRDMEEDVAKDPGERMGPHEPVVEEWELLTAANELEDSSDEDEKDGPIQRTTTYKKQKMENSTAFFGAKRLAISSREARRRQKEVKDAAKAKESNASNEEANDEKIGHIDDVDFADSESSEDDALAN